MASVYLEYPVEKLHERLDYNPDTGNFTWKLGSRKMRPGTAAGSIQKPKGQPEAAGYLMLGLDKKVYRANRVAWAMMTGVWPEKFIDHKDGDTLNNRWSNLREATYRESAQNRGLPSHSTTKLKGVRPAKEPGRWYGYIVVDGVQKHLGTFDSKELAGAAYQSAAQQHFGQFARL